MFAFIFYIFYLKKTIIFKGIVFPININYFNRLIILLLML